MNFDNEIKECLRIAGVKLNEAEDNSERIDQLMYDYERAEERRKVANFYDDYNSWSSGMNSAESRMREIEAELKELTGKGYRELLDTLGSKKVDKDKGPQLKVGDIYLKNGKPYEVEEISRNVIKTRDHQYVSYFYHIKEVDGPSIDVITDTDVKSNNKVE